MPWFLGGYGVYTHGGFLFGYRALYEPSYLRLSSDVRAATMANIEAKPDESHEERDISGQGLQGPAQVWKAW